MNIREILSSGQSKANTTAIVEYIGGDPERFAVLMSIFFKGEYRPTQRAAWPISVAAEKRPELLRPYLSKLVDQLPLTEVHSAVKRNVVRLLQYVEIPKRLQGKVYSHCLDLIADPGETIAVRAFAITVAERIAGDEPALREELRLVVSQNMAGATAAIRVRTRRILSGTGNEC